MLELAKNIAQLDQATGLLEEVVILNNASTTNYDSLKQYISTRPDIPFKYFDAPSNLGVARGRNYALARGSAPYVIMLDDDAVLQNKNALVNLMEEFNRKCAERPVAIISFKVLYYDSLAMQENALPHKRYKHFKDKSYFETYYYAGGAHAVKRSVMDQVGSYPPDFFYGMEEYDLGYRIIDAGYSIIYSDRIVMLHKESPLGRKPKEEKIRMMWVNKSKVAYRYLPLRYFLSTAVMWSLQYLKMSGFNVKGLFRGWSEIAKISSSEKRTPISKSARQYLRQTKARLWY